MNDRERKRTYERETESKERIIKRRVRYRKRWSWNE